MYPEGDFVSLCCPMVSLLGCGCGSSDMSEVDSRLGRNGIMRKEMFLPGAEPRSNLAALSRIIADLEVRFWPHLSRRKVVYLDHTTTISIEREKELLIHQITMHLIGTYTYRTHTVMYIHLHMPLKYRRPSSSIAALL